MDSWLFCTVENLFDRLAARMFVVVIPVQTEWKPYRENTISSSAVERDADKHYIAVSVAFLFRLLI